MPVLGAILLIPIFSLNALKKLVTKKIKYNSPENIKLEFLIKFPFFLPKTKEPEFCMFYRSCSKTFHINKYEMALTTKLFTLMNYF
jgi:hypothetical protein